MTPLPILHLVYNRTDTTQRVFEAIRRARPARLYVAGDGPRADLPGDVEAVERVRAIVQQVDWDCELRTSFSDENQGCRIAVSGAIDWFFENEEMGIILEDDCIPDPSFFPFCETLLARHRDDARIMMISGNNFQSVPNPVPRPFGPGRGVAARSSYYYSRHTHIWGWATWRRAWQHYDVGMRLWLEVSDSGWLEQMVDRPSKVKYWRHTFAQVHAGRVDTWDTQWLFACWIQSRLWIIPQVNLVTNIGFSHARATHTILASPFAEVPAESISFPLEHPPFVICNRTADRHDDDLMSHPLQLLRNRVRYRVAKLRGRG